MSDTPIREWNFYIEDMIRFAEKVIRYTQDHDQTSFIENEVYYDATLGDRIFHKLEPNLLFSLHPVFPCMNFNHQGNAQRNRFFHRRFDLVF